MRWHIIVFPKINGRVGLTSRIPCSWRLTRLGMRKYRTRLYFFTQYRANSNEKEMNYTCVRSGVQTTLFLTTTGLFVTRAFWFDFMSRPRCSVWVGRLAAAVPLALPRTSAFVPIIVVLALCVSLCSGRPKKVRTNKNWSKNQIRVDAHLLSDRNLHNWVLHTKISTFDNFARQNQNWHG